MMPDQPSPPGPSGPAPPSPPHDAGAGVAHAVEAVEQIVDRAVFAAERSLARRIGAGGLRAVLLGLRTAWWLIVLAYFVFGAAVLAARYLWLPRIDQFREPIAAAVGQVVQRPLSIGRIEADWQGLNPRLTLWDVRLQDRAGATVLALPQIETVLSWTSLIAWRPRFDSITVLAPELEVRRLPGNRFEIAGIVVDPAIASPDSALADWVLEQRRIAIRDARVHLVDLDQAGAAGAAAPAAADASSTGPAGGTPTESMSSFDLTDVNLVLAHGFRWHHFALQARPPARLAGPLDVRAEFQRPWSEPVSRIASWSGRLYLQMDYADLARVDAIAHLVPAPVRLSQANGAIRAWIDFSDLTVERMSADVAMTDVEARLRPDLQPLRLSSLQGRVTQRAWTNAAGSGREIALTQLTFEGPDGLKLAPTDLLYRVTQPNSAPEHTQFEASQLALADLSRLAAQVPLPPVWQSGIARFAARGTLSDVRAAWDGDTAHPAAYSLRARFFNLGCAADSGEGEAGAGAPSPAPAAVASAAAGAGPPPGAPGRIGRPGFSNLSGRVDFTQSGGTLQIDSVGAKLTWPGLFEEPDIDFGRLAARGRWSLAGSALTVNVDSLSAASDELEFNTTGSYRTGGKGPGLVDFSGRVLGGRAADAYRYVPSTALSARHWLRAAIVDGRIVDGSFRLRGDLADFPFVDPRNGEFHAVVRVADGRLDYAPTAAEGAAAARAGARARPAWPMLGGIDAEVAFDRGKMDISASRASVYGVRLSNIHARLPHLEQRDQHLAVDGQGSGPLADMLRFVDASPVGGLIGGVLARADAVGPARLALKLDIPLMHANDTEVAGTVTLQGDELTLAPEIAPFSGLSGAVDFTQHGVRLTAVTGGFIGGQVRVDGDTAADGSILISAAGTATPQGLKRQIEPAALRRLLDRMRGSAHYTAQVAVRHRASELHVDTDLVGLAIGLPEPLRKTAIEPLPLHFEVVPAAAPATSAGTSAESVRLTVGSLLSMQLERAGPGPDSMRIERGALGVGTPAVLPESGVLVHVDLPRLDWDRWSPVLDSLQGDGAVSGVAGSAGARVDFVAARVGELTFEGKPIAHLVLGASRGADDSWSANIDSDQASGSLIWAAAQRGVPGRLTARLARLTIPEQKKQQVAQLLDAPPNEIPALDIVADDFVLGSARLGHLELEAQNSGAGRNNAWLLQRLEIVNPDGKLSGSGQWEREAGSGAGPRRMDLKLSLEIANAGKLLERFGLAGALKNGNGKLEGDLSWHGSPFDIDYPSLAGRLHLETEKGQFLKADAGAARLLGVMSLQSLPRRISLDFRDVFSQGFAFDSVRANADIAAGVLTTHDFRMRGVSATALIDGTIDLKAETQSLHVLVLPEVNAGSASLVYALLANPAIGLGTFLAQLVLRDPLSKAFSYDYDVTGSWSDPLVKRRERPKVPPAPGSEKSTG